MGRVEQSESSDYERKSTEAPSIRDQFARSSCLQRQIQGEKGVYGQLHNSHEKNSSLQRRYTDKVFCDPLRVIDLLSSRLVMTCVIYSPDEVMADDPQCGRVVSGEGVHHDLNQNESLVILPPSTTGKNCNNQFAL
ncbi:unnamed protein product [Peronospora belbahrii]|uniref:Uncharacterized protein n=1 Tax=Peronospora belbahrii TaxID=622444 RepID=A0ABN8CX20_9STRA|nr:unnamed protein product [Peronospora belbahrii]